ncbi:2'-5' RNA ligase family protein [Microbacterium sp. BK668]|uniref:2'-5' RNA ligase family protein n=1 Tax=Microbacterium sp. BK668 TaxID=2512118 RepID=UPI0010E63207|nr:2'-5' RNA ligase family protein [Microbacterium sp. BK668]TDN91979.1 2'-5' RNA ligase superfamily protein [Microbacterium sp. BK668]
MFSVEILLDPLSEQAVRDEWDRLIDAGLPSTGRQTAPSNRPHITVAVRERVDASAVASVADALPLELALGGILLFGHSGRFVVTRQVIASAALLELHRRVAGIAGPAEPRYANTAPDQWTPHVTLARRVPAEQVATMLAVLESRPITGRATGLRVWDAVAKTVTTLR